ncbi:MAG: hypothetical protein HY287_08305 [Planctomycetes bacterium]|nr:hypothetical protein [Planctomycetota bacterium]MBI3834316.1 hypothetical protein [Planctomycetota bacterium]
MDRVYTTTQRGYSEISVVAIALKETYPTQRHIGILHRNRETNQVLLLDLAWHLKLRNDPPEDDYIWVDPPISPREATQVAMICRKVWRANRRRKVPYGFSAPNDSFDEETSEFLVGPTKFGLTCATFVLAIFHHAGLVLIDRETWVHRNDDTIFQQQVIRALAEGGTASKEHISHLESEVGCIRIRPEEVGSASAQSPWPVKFMDAVRLAEQILNLLNSLRQSEQ